jgi:hypothetical protein
MVCKAAPCSSPVVMQLPAWSKWLCICLQQVWAITSVVVSHWMRCEVTPPLRFHLPDAATTDPITPVDASGHTVDQGSSHGNGWVPIVDVCRSLDLIGVGKSPGEIRMQVWMSCRVYIGPWGALRT